MSIWKKLFGSRTKASNDGGLGDFIQNREEKQLVDFLRRQEEMAKLPSGIGQIVLKFSTKTK